MKNIIIGSRGSDLALWQANHVQQRLAAIGITAEIKIIKTQGDQMQHLTFDKLEGKGFFTKEIEEALLAKEIDLAVHSHKDLPTTSPDGLMIAAVSEREDPSELLLISKAAVDITQRFSLKKGAMVGTSSARRKSQLLAFRPDINLDELRGNVPTRIQKLRDGKYDAIMLAAAGVERLQIDLSDFHVEKLGPVEFVPAPAQGVLALQIRESDTALFLQLQALNSMNVTSTIALERKILNLFDGGCQLPLGVYCKQEQDVILMWAAKANAWNGFPVRIFKKIAIADYSLEKVPAIAQGVVDQITALKPKSVFITRNLDNDSYFHRGLKTHGYDVSGQSLIETHAISYSAIPKTDWIFFSSQNAVKYFFEQQPVLDSNIKYAVIGKGTAQALRAYGKVADFVGNALPISNVGKAFAEKLGDGARVLFPQAADSLQSVQKELGSSIKVHNLDVYKTLPKKDFTLPKAEVLLFTSPSNVTAYFEADTISEKQHIIAIGHSTGKELELHGVTNYTLPYSSDELGLIEALFSL